MTKGALEMVRNKINQDIEAKRRMNDRYIEAKKLEHDREQQALNRQNQRKIARAHDTATIVGSSIGTAGRIVSNDPNWYKRYLSNAEEFVRVPTFDRLGAKNFGKLYRYSDATSITSLVPGIMIYGWQPTIGKSQGDGSVSHANEPINQSLARLKEKILSLNSRSSVNWEPADLGLNFMATADIMSLILELGRVIKVYNTYHATNAYFAQSLITALGFSYSDVSTKFAEYRKTYAMFARKFNSAIVAPSGASFYLRRAYLASNIFADSKDADYPRQVYAFVEKRFLRLRNDATGCDMITKSSNITLATYTSLLNASFTYISDNPDFVEMYQDMRHAFGKEVVSLPESVEGEVIALNTDDLNRQQIANMDIIPAYMASGNVITYFSCVSADWAVLIDTAGYLYQERTVNTGASVASAIRPYFTLGGRPDLHIFIERSVKRKLYNVYEQHPNGDTILDITRFNYALDALESTDGANPSGKLIDCGTEVVVDAYSYGHTTNGISVTLTPVPVPSLLVTPTYIGDIMDTISCWSAFDWVHTFTMFKDNTYIPDTFTLCETYTTFEINWETMASINSVCVMSEFYVPDSTFASWH